ncbi:MAG: deoxynucleoside kinase [Candidatus Marsarchaeota archaeon]|nr:deoxynucleoside kinase [Candidatus Marsarchaeota archaeon]MCL5101893.1 deoxynucleoside kinase [Candidatus Marsarchaeota archaeon]
MAFTVVIDGKPCSGKTTLSKAVEQKLNSEGITALDAKSEAMEKGPLSGLLRKFAEGEIDSFRALLHSATYHTLSYVALELSSWANKKNYEVIMLQRSPYAFSFMIEAAKIASGKDYGHYEQSGFLYGIIESWAKFVKPDLFIYLTADVNTLMSRFEHRSDGRDRVHKQMILEDDSLHIKLLRGYMQEQKFIMVDNTTSIEESTKRISSIIKDSLLRTETAKRHNDKNDAKALSSR